VDVENIIESGASLRKLIQREQDSGIAAERIFLAGFSQGGAIVLHTGLRFEQPLAGLLALSTYSPTISNLAKERSDANRKIPIIMAHGRFDPMIPMSNAIDTRKELVRMNYAVQWHEYPMQHEVCLAEVEDISAWMLNLMKK
jgi:phospholipase/carboxylesterase